MFSRNPFIRKSVSSITVGIKVNVFKEGDYFIAYCQELELSSYGETAEQAKERFNTEVKIFFEETHRKGTLEKLLLKLGWKLTQKPEPKYEPPVISADNHHHLQGRLFQEKVAIPI